MEQYLIFKVSKEKYALNIKHVREVVDYKTPEQVPNANEYILGMLSLREEIIAIMDSAIILNTKIENIHSPNNKIIIFETSKNHVGLIVESVSEVISIEESSIDPPPLLKTAEEYETYVKGVTTQTGELIIIVDSSKTELNMELKA
jgi:purine-binding chemotaxis protein CheW